jgi:hypothetical protein
VARSALVKKIEESPSIVANGRGFSARAARQTRLARSAIWYWERHGARARIRHVA